MYQQISGEAPYRRSRLVYPVTSPAAGADWSYTVPAGKTWELVTVYAQLVTDANVAAREAHFQIGDGNAVYLDLPPVATQAATLTRTYAWVQWGATLAVGTGQVQPLPRLMLDSGFTIAVATGLKQAGDQWSAIRLQVVETTERLGPSDFGAPGSSLEEVLAGMAG